MTGNNVIKIIFILLLGIFTLYPQVSFAESCTNDAIEKALGANADNIKEFAKQFKEAANTFNEKASAYISECGEPSDQKRTMEWPDDETSERISLAGEDITETEYWANTAYYWSGVRTDIPSCQSKLAEVNAAKSEFDKKRDQLFTEANRAVQGEKDLCTCDEFGARMMCWALREAKKLLTNKCKKFPEYLAEFSTCPLCGLFAILLRTIAQISKLAWDAVAAPLSVLLKTVFLALLALEVLKTVGAVGGAKLSEFAKNVLLLSAKVAVAVALLSNPRYIYGYFLSPVLEGGLNMGVEVANSAGGGGHLAKDPNDDLSIPSDTFDSSVYDTVMSTVRAFGISAAELPAIGRGLSCHAWDNFLGLPKVSMWITGAIFYILGIIIWLAVSFYMIDCTVQVGMLSGLVPLLIACWPFKMTESYTYKGCKMLMNSFFSYVMIGVVLLISTQVCLGALSGTGSNIAQITEAINNDDIETLEEICDMGGFQILILGACAIFAIKIIGTANDLADQFSKGSGSRIGSKMGGAVMNAATSAAKSTAKIGGRALGSVGSHAAAATGIAAKFNKATDAIKGGWQKGWAKAGRSVGLGKYQNQQTGSGKGGTEGSGPNPGGGDNPNPQNDNPNPDTPGGGGNNPNPQNDNPNPDTPGGGGDNPNPSIRDSDGKVTLANGEKVNGLGVATRNPDGGVTFTAKGADGSRTVDSYDKDGNRSVQTYDGKGEMTSSFQQNKDGSSSGFIKREDGSIDRWNDKAGTYKNVGAVQERNNPGGKDTPQQTGNTKP